MFRRMKGFGKGAIALLAITGFAIDASAGGTTGMVRLSAQSTALDGNVILLPSGVEPGDAGTTQIYNNTVTVPPANNVMYVTINSNGLGTCDGIALQCQIDGVDCLNGNGLPGTGLPDGWVNTTGGEFGLDGAFGPANANFQWCMPITKGTHTVTINGATEFGDCNTYLEAVHVYVDVSRVPNTGPKNSVANACGSYATPNPTTSPD